MMKKQPQPFEKLGFTTGQRKKTENIYRVFGEFHGQISRAGGDAGRVTFRQMFAFIYFARNDIDGEPRILKSLRYEVAGGKFENMTTRELRIFFERNGEDKPSDMRLGWLRSESNIADRRENFIRLTDAGLEICKLMALIQSEVETPLSADLLAAFDELSKFD